MINTMKLSWGKRIMLLYGGFVMLIAALVIGSMRQSFDLVATDYYSQEIKYQDVLDADKNLSALSERANVITAANMVVISFPREFTGKVIKGQVHFYSPIKTAWDKKLDLNTVDNKMIIERNQLKHTNYTAKISWSVDGRSYYQETQLNL